MRTLTELEAKNFLFKHGIPITKQKLAKNENEAVKFANEFGCPVVMKIVSPDILHKTEAKGVAINVCTGDVSKTFQTLVKNAKNYKKNARIHGVLIQEMAKGQEIIIGTSIDPQFGPVIMFGLGGIFVEVLKDVSFRIIPIKKNDAMEMLDELKGKAILEGARGIKINKNSIVDTLLKVSNLIQKNPNIKELDINPLFVDSKSCKAADARIILK